MLFPNGLKVLSLLGLATFATNAAPNLEFLRDISSNGTVLGGTDLPKTWKEKYGQPACGVKRSALNLALKNGCLAANIPVLEGWKLADIIETEDGVTAISQDGRQEEGSFLIGCDGIRSATRTLVLKGHGLTEEEATFTHLTQIASMSPTPSLLKSNPGMINWYGTGAHFIAIPMSPTTTSWAITQRSETEEVETWQHMSLTQLGLFKSNLLGQFGDWCDPIPELISGAERIIKYGLYDRPHIDPQQWVSEKGRCVLIGDAAHPTSPHLGQGANQALEDCSHLARMLPDVDVDIDNGKLELELPLEREKLRGVFLEFAGMRQLRTRDLVVGARMQGERRVVVGGREGVERDEVLRRGWVDESAVEKRWKGLLREPF